MKKIISLFLVFAMSFCVFGIRSEAKTLTGIKADNMFQKGRYIYYTHPQYGNICRYDIKTKTIKTLRGKDGTVWGYHRIIVKGMYIYAELDTSIGSDGQVVGAELYRISLDGKKRKRLVPHLYFNFSIVGKRIYYNELIGGDNYNEKKGARFSIKLNGTDKRSASGVKIKRSSKSAVSGRNYDKATVLKSGGYKYVINKDQKVLKRNGRVLLRAKGADWIPNIGTVIAHKGHLIVEYNYSKKNASGVDGCYCKLYYMDKNGKNKKVLSDFMPAS